MLQEKSGSKLVALMFQHDAFQVTFERFVVFLERIISKQDYLQAIQLQRM